MKPYISFIIPVYNVSAYLGKCVESIVSQITDLIQIEVILVDDGSTDDSGKLCDHFENQYCFIKAFHKHNGGLSDARNYGFSHAVGKYIIFVDSDDFIGSGTINKIIEDCKKQNEPEVMFLHAVKYYEDNTTIPYDSLMDSKKLNQGYEYALAYLNTRSKYPASAWSKMVSRDLLLKNSISFVKGQLSEDYMWTLKVLEKATSFGASNINYYYYRQNRKGSITRDVSEKHFRDLLDILDYFVAEAAKYEVAVIEHGYILKSAAYIYCITLYDSYKFFNNYKDRIVNNKFLLSYAKGKKFQIINCISKLIGLRATVCLLNIYRNRR